MKKKLLLTFLLIYVLSIIQVWAEPNLEAPSDILIDAKTGRVLFEKNAEAKMYPASTTKIMTCILALEHGEGKLNDIVTIGTNPSTMIERGSSQIYLIPGEEVTFEQLLYALMLPSANDAAVAIAEYISGSVDDFVALMNAKAKELGCTNTHFTNTNGLPDDDHYTTAHDLALIAQYAMQNEMFRKLVSTVSHNIPATNKQEERNYIRNTNKLISDSPGSKYHYPDAIGIKTGYTGEARHALVGGAKKGDTELISVVLGADTTDIQYNDSIALLNYGFDNFSTKKLLEKNQIVTTIPIPDTDIKINLLAQEDFTITLSEDELDKLKSSIVIYENIEAPILKNQKLGSITYSLNNEEIKSINLLAEEGYEKPPVPLYMKVLKNWKWIILGILVLFLIYRTIVTVRKARRRRRNKYTFIKR